MKKHDLSNMRKTAEWLQRDEVGGAPRHWHMVVYQREDGSALVVGSYYAGSTNIRLHSQEVPSDGNIVEAIHELAWEAGMPADIVSKTIADYERRLVEEVIAKLEQERLG